MTRTEVRYNGEIIEVHYDYQPEEKQTRDYPGCYEDVTIEMIVFNGVDVTNLMENSIEELEGIILDKRNEILK